MAQNARTALNIPPEIMEKLKKEAEEQNRTVHNLILTILRDHFKTKD